VFALELQKDEKILMTQRIAASLGFGLSVCALALISAACSSTSEPSGDVDRGAVSGDAMRIIAEDTDFRPAMLDAGPGSKVTVEIINKDDTSHDFAVESMGLNTGTIDANQIATATFKMPDNAVGFVCTYHDGMTGRIEPR
jgi:plastocyanin